MDEFTKAIQEQDVHTLSDLIETGQIQTSITSLKTILILKYESN